MIGEEQVAAKEVAAPICQAAQCDDSAVTGAVTAPEDDPQGAALAA